MTDPYARPGGDTAHGQWPSNGGYQGQYAESQLPYQGYHPGFYPGQDPTQGYYGHDGRYIPPRTHGVTVFAMITGIVAAVISLIPFFGFIAFVLGPLAMVLGIVAIAKRIPRRGFSVTALVTGTFGVLVSILYAVLFSTLMSFFDNTQSFEFRASGDSEYQVAVTTTSESPETSDRQGSFKQTVDASTLYGAITVTAMDPAGGTVGCEIYDSIGNLLVADDDQGPHATASCELSDVLLRKVEDIEFPEEISAHEAN